MSTYADAGVDVNIEAEAAKIFYEAAKTTWHNRQNKLGQVDVPFDDFSGSRSISVEGLPRGTFMNIGFDTVGTKAEIAQRVGRHDTLGYDLVAMVADDAVVRGAEPVIMGSNLETNTLGTPEKNYLEQIRQLATGYAAGANAAGVAIVNGETAQVGDAVGGYGDFRYNWGASLVWFANKKRMLTGSEIRPGDTLIALRESGMRCNGFSLIRRILQQNYGDNWHNNPFGQTTFGEEVLKPSQIYAQLFNEMLGGWDLTNRPTIPVHGVAHITGGGMPEKIGRMVKPSGYGAGITSPFTPNELTLHLQQIGRVSDYEAYKTWNMGQGMVIATPEPDAVQTIIERYQMESKIIGTIISEPAVHINSKGLYAASEGQLSYRVR